VLIFRRLLQPLSKLKNGGTSGKAPVKIVDPGASWRRFFRAVFTMKDLIAIFPFFAPDEGVFCFCRRLSLTLTKSPPFSISQGKEMMLFPASPFVFLD
jgi:hypothetical protein